MSKAEHWEAWLVRSFSDRAALVRALAGYIALCSWARHFTLTVSLSTQVYKWVPVNLMLGVILRWTSITSRREKKYFKLVYPTETGISSGLMGYLAREQNLPLSFTSCQTAVDNAKKAVVRTVCRTHRCTLGIPICCKLREEHLRIYDERVERCSFSTENCSRS